MILQDPTDRNLSSEDRLVAAGIALLAEDPWGVVARGLDRQRMAKRANMSRTTAHQVIPDHTELIRRIGERLLALPLVEPFVSQVTRDIDEVTSAALSNLGPADGVRAIASDHFAAIVAEPVLRTQIFAAAASASEDHVRAINAEVYSVVQDQYAQSYADLLHLWNLQLLPTVTLELLSRALTALLEGYVLRSIADRSVTADEFAEAVMLLFSACVMPIGEPRRKGFPAIRHAVSTEQILTGASNVADRVGLRTTIEEVEDRLGVPVGFVTDRYPTVNDLVHGFWDEFASTTLRLQIRSGEPGHGRRSGTVGGLSAIIEHALDHRGMAQLYIAQWLDGAAAPITRQQRDPLARELTKSVPTSDRSAKPADIRRRSLAAVHAAMTGVLTEPPPKPANRARFIAELAERASSQLG